MPIRLIRLLESDGWKIGPLGQLIIDSGTLKLTCWVHTSPFEDDGSPYAKRILSLIPGLSDGDVLYSPHVSMDKPHSGTYLIAESDSLAGAINNIRNRFPNLPLPEDGLMSLRPTLSYRAPEEWLKSQPGFDPKLYQRAKNFNEKLKTLQQIVQGTIDKTMTVERLATLNQVLRELDEHDPVPGIPTKAKLNSSPDITDRIIGLWQMYKKNPSPDLMFQIQTLRSKIT